MSTCDQALNEQSALDWVCEALDESFATQLSATELEAEASATSGRSSPDRS